MEEKEVIVIIYNGLVEGVFENEYLAKKYCVENEIQNAKTFFTPLKIDKEFEPLTVTEEISRLLQARNALYSVRDFKKTIEKSFERCSKNLDFHIETLELTCNKLSEINRKRKKED